MILSLLFFYFILFLQKGFFVLILYIKICKVYFNIHLIYFNYYYLDQL